MARPVSATDFEMSDDGPLHVLTGAMFWTFPESTEPYKVTWGTAGEPEDDDEYVPKYEREELREMALELLKERTKNEPVDLD